MVGKFGFVVKDILKCSFAYWISMGGKFSFVVKDILTCSFAYCWLARAPTKVRARYVRISLIYFVRKGTSERIELVLSLVLASWLCIFSVRGLFLVFRRPPQFFFVFSSSSRSENNGLQTSSKTKCVFVILRVLCPPVLSFLSSCQKEVIMIA